MNTIWDLVKPEFTPAENWGAHSDLSGFALMLLLILRRESGWPIVIHNAVEYSGHSENSQHYKGNAADWHFDTEVPLSDQVVVVQDILHRFQLTNFVGMGIYPFWNSPGFHTDARGCKARWGFDKEGNQISFEEALKWA